MTSVLPRKPVDRSIAARTGLAERIVQNARIGLGRLTKAPHREAAYGGLGRPGSGVVIGAVLTAILTIGLMLFLDANSIIWARTLPLDLRSLSGTVTKLGLSGWFLYPLGFLLVAIAFVDTGRLSSGVRATVAAISARVGFLFIAIGLPGLFVTIAKHIIGRARPFVPGYADPFAYSPLNWSAAYASMPSGHAATAFSAAVAFGALFPKFRLPLFAYAAVIGMSRIVVTAHHPSDVVVGAVVGAGGALLVRRWFAARRLGFTADPDGRIRAYAWPSFGRMKAVAARLFEK